MLKFGLAGCGHIAKKHFSALEEIDQAGLVAVCDSDLQRLAPFKSHSDLAIYDDYEEFLQDTNIEAVIITTPSGLHASMGEKAARAGKHILMEKPFVLNLNEGANLVKLCQREGVKLAVVHPNRFKPAVQALFNAVSQGWFGTITHASAVLRWHRSQEYFQAAPWRGTREMDGGILFNQAIHNLDLFNWLAGPVEEVFAYGATRVHQIQCEDVCTCALKLKGGGLGVVEAAITIYPENLEESLALFGSQGTVVLGGRSLAKIKEWKFSCLTPNQAEKQAELLNKAPAAQGHREVIADFTDAVLNDREPMVSGLEALKVLRLIEGIYQSIAGGKPVKITGD